ncbi:esterase E4-like [Vespa velutina]|uniref:esterase E4-like n=1 Tax=Vespa velutina TaxID=202808 RepID=UPI001FB27CA1|nr:esterase E4-like [Vespa velutina]
MNGRISILLVILSLLITSSKSLRRQKRIIGGSAAAEPPIDDPVVFVNKNGRDARILGIREQNSGYYSFRGIRYAEPPIGLHRFQRPKAANLAGDLNATTWGAPCPQINGHKSKEIIGSEDCLFLNIFTPVLPDASEGYPVLIWIHGGGFRRGSACQYEMKHLIKKKIIVVSIQYRLGSLGFLSTGTKDLPGNNGLFDMILAVNWIKDYIEFFGGNPRKIIAFGHGTGAISALMLTLSKLSSGIFNGIIAMSGTILSHFAIDKDPLNTAKYIGYNNGCPTNDTKEMVQCLRELSIDKLIEVDSRLEYIRTVSGVVSSISTLLTAGPVIEGSDDERSLPNLITETPEESLKLGNFPNIPLLIGIVKDEIGGAIFGDYKNELEEKLRTIPNYLSEDLIPSLQKTIPNIRNTTKFAPEVFEKYLNIFQSNKIDKMKKVAEAMGDSLFNAPIFLTVEHWSKKAKAFLYSFDYDGERCYGKDFLSGLPIVDAKQSLKGINHGDDLGYIFDRNNIVGEKIKNAIDKTNEIDEHVTEIFTGMISNFARTGKPDMSIKSENNTWLPKIVPNFSESNSFVSINSVPKMMENFRYCEMGLWTGLSGRLQSPACNLLKSTSQVVNNVGTDAKNVIEKPIKNIKNINNIVPKMKPTFG